MSIEIKENVLLKDYSSFKIGGEAKYFCICKSKEEVKEAIEFAISEKIKVFILGNGTNLLISDDGFDGLVIKIQGDEVDIKNDGNIFEVRVGAGKVFSVLIFELIKKGISGLEWGAGIPALMGGVVCNNAGAYGSEISDSIKSVIGVELFFDKNKNLEGYKEINFKKGDCEFSYRNSVFKKNKKFIILETILELQKGDSEKMQTEVKERIQKRNQKQPLEYPNIGSIFKNPKLNSEQIADLVKKYPEKKSDFENGVSAGFLIEAIGFKERKVGAAMISEKHANFIVNIGGATSEDVIILIGNIKEEVYRKFNIRLHEEIEYVGF